MDGCKENTNLNEGDIWHEIGMKKLVGTIVKGIIAILAVDIILVPIVENAIDPGNPGAFQGIIGIVNIVGEVSSTVHNLVNNLVEGLSAAEFIDYLVITIVIVFFIICIFDRGARKTKVILIDEPE